MQKDLTGIYRLQIAIAEILITIIKVLIANLLVLDFQMYATLLLKLSLY